MKKLFFSLFIILLLQSSCTINGPILKIGLVADPQYANKATVGKRNYRESLWKLEEAIDSFNYYNVDFVQNLGDIIDIQWESFDSILPIYEKLNPDIENYHLLGNHDFDIDSSHFKDLLGILSMPNYYYSYVKKGWRFIVLDATDYSYYSNSLHKHDINKVNSYYENTKWKTNKKVWNSAIGDEQQNWLKQELDKAQSLNQNVILFSHLPLRPEDNSHNLWNDYEIIELIDNYSNIVAFINGHNHSGNYLFKNGIHFVTLYGMVETKNNSFGILEIYKNNLALKGYGKQKTIHLKYE